MSLDWSKIIESFRNTGSSFEMCLPKDSPNSFNAIFDVGQGVKMKFNIKDELLSVKKDISILDTFKSTNKLDSKALTESLKV